MLLNINYKTNVVVDILRYNVIKHDYFIDFSLYDCFACKSLVKPLQWVFFSSWDMLRKLLVLINILVGSGATVLVVQLKVNYAK